MIAHFDMLRAKPVALIGIVQHVLDGEIDAPPTGSVEHRALGAFVQSLLSESHFESWPELDAVRETCQDGNHLEPPPPPPEVTLGPELDFWQRAYLASLSALMGPHQAQPYSEEHLARLSVIAETSASLAVHNFRMLAKKSGAGLGWRMIDVGRLALAQRERGL